MLRDNHQRLRRRPRGHPRHAAPSSRRDDALYDEFVGDVRAVATCDALAAAAYDLESTLVATHTELLGQLEGIDGARLIASILIVEARHGTVLADVAGHGDDLDALFVNDADAAAPPSGGGG